MLMPTKKVLCVCSCNQMRSPTMAWVLANTPYNFDTRSCGTDSLYFVVRVSKELVGWADEIVCADAEHERWIRWYIKQFSLPKQPKILCLNIPDHYEYKQPELISLIVERYNEITVE